jgi:hypothetical protein
MMGGKSMNEGWSYLRWCCPISVLGLDLGAEDGLLDGLAYGNWDGIIDGKDNGALLGFKDGSEDRSVAGIMYSVDDRMLPSKSSKPPSVPSSIPPAVASASREPRKLPLLMSSELSPWAQAMRWRWLVGWLGRWRLRRHHRWQRQQSVAGIGRWLGRWI